MRLNALRSPIAHKAAAAAMAVGIAGSALGLALVGTAGAREFDRYTITVDRQSKAYPRIENELANPRKQDPDTCRTADYCDTIPVQIPIPDKAPGDDYTLRIRIDWNEASQLTFILWDDGQLKEKYGKKQPGETGYDPLESDYSDLLVSSNPKTAGPDRDGWMELSGPDLIDYNITIHNFGGFDEGYTITSEILVESFDAPEERTPPTFSAPFTPPPTFVAPAPVDTTPTTDPFDDAPGLNDLIIAGDPDLSAIQSQNLLDQLAAPPVPIARSSSGPGEAAPVSGLTIVFWLGIVPGLLAAAGTVLVLRRRALVAI